MTPASTLRALVRDADGVQILCKVVQIVSSPFVLLPLVQLQAVDGRPFNNRREVVVQQNKVYFTSRQS